MLTNYHTHTSFCDGANTPEEIVLYAIDRGFGAIGFSGHGYTEYDLRYCMKDTEGYINEIQRLKQKYSTKIKIYLGVEEDSYSPLPNRNSFDYIIGSCHYFLKDGKHYPFDSTIEHFKNCLDLYNYDISLMAEEYFLHFCEYLKKYRPHMIGHYDYLAKYNEKLGNIIADNEEYRSIALKYTKELANDGFIFEVNTGAISRGINSTPYPCEELLRVIKNSDSGVCLASDSHKLETLDACFKETRALLKDIGFTKIYNFIDGRFVPENI